MLVRLRRLVLPLLVLSALVLAACGGGDETDSSAQDGATGASGGAGASAAPLRYAVLGDSNSNGENAGPGQQASPKKIAWPAQLSERLTEQGLPVKLVANLAISGATVEQTVAEELPALEGAKPDVATLMIGGNDYVAGVMPPEYRKGYRDLLDEVIATVGDPERVLTVSVPAFYETPTGALYVDPKTAPGDMARFNEIARQESEDAGVQFVDIVDVSESMGEDPSLVTPDGLHPTEEELGLWTDEIAPAALERWAALSGK